MPILVVARAMPMVRTNRPRCWIHLERQIRVLDTFTEEQRDAIEAIRARVWQLYADLKAWRDKPTPRRRRKAGRLLR